jgi:glutathione S-transferase
MLRLHYSPLSTFSQRVRIALLEARLMFATADATRDRPSSIIRSQP